ncbi:MAG: DUF3795 domain-containing protein [Planctomycetota bacterium]|jgi:hypothetical protein
MDEIIGYCGLNCCTCPIYVATREKDNEKKHKMRVEIAEQILKLYGTKYKPEQITDCDGCKTQGGRMFAGSLNCPLRNCASGKALESCAYCAEYPCEELEKLFADYPEDGKLARQRLDQIRAQL